MVKNKVHLFCSLLQKPFEKSTCAALSIYPSDAHARKHVKFHHFCKTLCCITTTGNTVQQHQWGKQATDKKLCTVYSAKQLRNPAKFTGKLQIILTKFCNIRFKKWRPTSMRPPRFRHLCMEWIKCNNVYERVSSKTYEKTHLDNFYGVVMTWIVAINEWNALRMERIMPCGYDILHPKGLKFTRLWYTITLWNSIGYNGNKRMERNEWNASWLALAGVADVRVALVGVTLVWVAAVHSSAYISFLNRFLSVCLWAAIAPLTLSNDQIKSGVCVHC